MPDAELVPRGYIKFSKVSPLPRRAWLRGATRWDSEAAMKLIAEYLDIAIKFEGLAAEESPSKLKESFEKQAAAYRKLAAKRAKKFGIPEPPGSISHVVKATPVGEAQTAPRGGDVASWVALFWKQRSSK
jgi:hypothetical protein